MVLTKCRKSLEVLNTTVQKLGFKKEIIVEKKTQTVTDWKEFFEDKKAGQLFSCMYQKVKSFTSSGAHTGKAISRKDANLALMITHSMTYYILRTFRPEE